MCDASVIKKKLKILYAMIGNNSQLGEEESPTRSSLKVQEVDPLVTLSERMLTMNDMLKSPTLGNQAPVVAVSQVATPMCSTYNEKHLCEDCP